VKKTSKRTSASPKPSARRRAKPGRSRAAPTRAPQTLALVAFAKLARRLGLRWYVFGAQAVNLHGFPRATADIDLTIFLDGRSVRDVIAHLRKAGFDPRFDDEAFIAVSHVIAVSHRASGLPMDLVLAGPGLEQRFLDEVEHHLVDRQRIPVLSLENLVVTKVLAGRPRDLEDVRELVQRHPTIDHGRIEMTLKDVEDALGQSDLRPLYRSLR
jgi:hypothetical protein